MAVLKTFIALKMDPVRRKALGRSNSKPGKLKKAKRTTSLLRRQSEFDALSTRVFARAYMGQEDKTWLETHVWHAKRMHMDNMWGYKLVRENRLSQATRF